VAQLEAALKNVKPIQFKENIALVLKYFDKLPPLIPLCKISGRRRCSDWGAWQAPAS
jgi:hypothetical protein